MSQKVENIIEFLGTVQHSLLCPAWQTYSDKHRPTVNYSWPVGVAVIMDGQWVVSQWCLSFRMHQLAFCDTILERNKRTMFPTSTDGAGVSANNPLDAFFPFDPFLLNRQVGRLSRRQAFQRAGFPLYSGWAVQWVGCTVGGLYSGWAVQWVGCTMGGLYNGWAVQWVGCPVGGLYSGWAVQRVGCTVGGLYSGWAVQWVGCTVGGLSSGWAVQRVGCPVGGLSSGWAVQRVGCTVGGLYTGYSSFGWNLDDVSTLKRLVYWRWSKSAFVEIVNIIGFGQ